MFVVPITDVSCVYDSNCVEPVVILPDGLNLNSIVSGGRVSSVIKTSNVLPKQDEASIVPRSAVTRD